VRVEYSQPTSDHPQGRTASPISGSLTCCSPEILRNPAQFHGMLSLKILHHGVTSLQTIHDPIGGPLHDRAAPLKTLTAD
jgi:hypothetical protein